MNTIGLIYWSGSGNTESMAEMLKDAFDAKDANLYYSAIEDADADEFFGKDILIFGSPACGTEEINETDMEPFLEDHADKLEGRKVFMFGSYGWGGGEFMENWSADMTGNKKAEIVVDPVVCLEAPEDDTKEALEQAAEALLDA